MIPRPYVPSSNKAVKPNDDRPYSRRPAVTPGIIQAEQARIPFEVHSYTHDDAEESYGLEAARKLGIDPGRVFKTLVASLSDGKLAVAVVPVSTKLNLKALAKTLKVKKAGMAEAGEVERSTGYVLGGVSPLGQKKKLLTVIDDSARDCETLFVSAGRRGLELELAPGDLLQLTRGRFAAIGT